MKLKPYSSYKDSGIEWLGEIPENWAADRLKRICEVLPSNVDKKSVEGEQEVRLCNYTDVYYREEITNDLELMKATASLAQIERFTLRKDDVIITKDSETADDIGIPTYIPNDLPGVVCGYHLSMIRPRRNASGKFIKRLFDSHYLRAKLEISAQGLTRVGLGQYEIDNLDIPLPSYLEQCAIATFLDRETSRLDTLIAKQVKLIELLQEKRQAIISHAVTKGLNPDAKMKDSDVEWLGEVPEHWGVKRLKHIKATFQNAFVDGPFGSNLKSEHFIQDGDVYVIESNFATQNVLTLTELKTITRSHFETIRRSETQEGDIIIAKIGAQFGKASILPSIDKPAVVSGNSMKLSVNENLCGNLWAYWQLVNLKMLGVIDQIPNGSAQPALSLGDMNNLPFLLPSIDEQKQILNFLNRETNNIDTLISKAQRSIELAKEHRTALISAAVTGKIDVREAA